MKKTECAQSDETQIVTGVPDSADGILLSLTPEEFFDFWCRAFRADHTKQGGVRQSCEDRSWFPKVASLFTEGDGRFLHPEAARTAHAIALIRNIIGGSAKDVIASQKRFPTVVSETDDPVRTYLYGSAT